MKPLIDNTINKIRNALTENYSCDELCCLLTSFSEAEMNKMLLTEGNGGLKWNVRLPMAESLYIIVKELSQYCIGDISWELFCKMLIFIIKQDKYKHLLGYISKIYLYIIDNTSIETVDLNILKRYREIFTVDYYSLMGVEQINKNDIHSLYGYMGYKSEIDHICLFQDKRNTYVGNNRKVVVNLNTKKIFLRQILSLFIEDILMEGRKNSKIGQLEYKQFIYYFEDSLYESDKIPCKIEEFTYDTFKKQYKFYKKFYSRTARRIHWNNPVSVLKEFYIYMNNYLDKNIINHDIFKKVNIGIDELINKNFSTYYEEGYVFINRSYIEEMPISNRWAVKADSKTSSQRYKILVFDFTKIRNKKYRDECKRFIWWETSVNMNTKYTYFRDIVDFLNYKNLYDNINKNIIYGNSKDEFTTEFIFQYRSKVFAETENCNSRINKFKAIRKYLEYYAEYYKLSKMHFKYLSIRNKSEDNIKTLKSKEFQLIYEEFLKRKDTSVINELYYIIFNLKSTTQLRIGEILNLERNCILNKMNKDGEYKDEVGEIQLYTKVQQYKKKKIYIEKEKLKLINRAIEITEEYVKNSINEEKRYIFIVPYRKFSTRNNSGDTYIFRIQENGVRLYFQEIQKKVLGTVKYKLYNLRHTYKSTIYNEGSKENLPIQVLENLTGTKYKTDIKCYVDSRDVQLYTEIFCGVTISDVNIKGQILSSECLSSMNPVENNIGCCKEKGCISKENFRCLICSSFVTSINKKLSFENKILDIKKRMCGQLTDYERKFLYSELKLYGAYLSKILEIINKDGD